jgi:hypothetical protein
MTKFGYKQTPEHVEKNRIARKKFFSDPKNLEAHKENMRLVMNKPDVKERHRTAMKEFCAKQDKTERSGPNNPNWKGGTTPHHIPIKEAKGCASYLGVYIAERVLSTFFDNMKRMPYNNKGYDYICGKGYKIDVKSSCLHYRSSKLTSYWDFSISRNCIADYFLCLAFNNREDLEPMYIWLIPGNVINSKFHLTIPNNETSFNKLNKYMKPIDKVIDCCNVMKKEIIS